MSEDSQIMELPERTQVVVSRPPDVVLSEAKKAATALMEVVRQKKKPVIMNGEQYLEYEDWQTVGRFYGCSVKTTDAELVEFGAVKGFRAKAFVIRNSDGMIVSSADAMCLNDEDKWSTRPKYEWVNGTKTKTGDIPVPLFQLMSMAQTRAGSKALRNAFAWVVVLAGFKPTPAEEMTGFEVEPSAKSKTMPERPSKAGEITDAELNAALEPDEEVHIAKDIRQSSISEPQRKRLYAIAMGAGMTRDRFPEWLMTNYSIKDSKDIPIGKYNEICDAAKNWKP